MSVGTSQINLHRLAPYFERKYRNAYVYLRMRLMYIVIEMNRYKYNGKRPREKITAL